MSIIEKWRKKPIAPKKMDKTEPRVGLSLLYSKVN